MSKLIKDSFSAWVDKMPGAERKLIVKGEAEVPTGGWNSKISRRNPQGINENTLILDVELIQPGGVATQVISKIECRYEEAPLQHPYTDVTISSDEEEFTIPVGEAS